MTILDEILQEKRIEVKQSFDARAGATGSKRQSRPSLFNKLYGTEHLQVIAEMKRASPSKGLIAKVQIRSLKQKPITCRSSMHFGSDGHTLF